MAEKKIKGRKRHIVTDTMGHLLNVKVHAANIHDTVSGGEIFKSALKKYPSIVGCCADAGYRKTFESLFCHLEKPLKYLRRSNQRHGWSCLSAGLLNEH